MDSLVFGQEFSRKLCNLPAPWFIDNMLLPLARKISPALRVGNLEQPYLYSPLITASQVRIYSAWFIALDPLSCFCWDLSTLLYVSLQKADA
jgi:hypothetical protein